MHIHHTAQYFIKHYQPSTTFLARYYECYSKSFQTYFNYHCANKQEKMIHAIKKYPFAMERIADNSEKIEAHIRNIALAYEQRYQVTIDINIHIIVGVFTSNAFANRKAIPDLTFCLEQLSSQDTHIQVIVAHEFGHVLHGILSEQAEVDWSQINWTHPYTMLLQEGCATYFSTQVVEAENPIYFTYNDDGAQWYEFAKENIGMIIRQFLHDVNDQSEEDLYHEWFSINGGKHFGYTRLAYYIGFKLVETLLTTHSLNKAVTIWESKHFYEEVENMLKSTQ